MINSIFDRISYHAVYDHSIIDALQFGLKNGFTGIQIADEAPHLSFECLSGQEIEEIARFRQEHNMRIVIHAPDDAASLYQCSRYLQAGILEYFRALFSFAEQIGVQLITIHVGKMTEFPTNTMPEERIPSQDYAIYARTATENLRRILELADGRFTICVENYQMDTAIIELLMPFLEHEELALCWDLAKSNPTVEPFFLEHLRHVKQVHLHDKRHTSKGLKGHRVIGTGELDFRYYFDALRQADVLDYCIEVRPQEKAKESLIALQRILQTENME